jgi:hypothetical protein
MDQSVIVSSESFASSEPGGIAVSNAGFVNQLFTYFRPQDISRDALRSFYVYNYLGEMNNGGFSQFVYNSGWSQEEVKLVREGLAAMKAGQHLKLFNQSAAIIDRMGPERLKAFLASEYFGTNEERDLLNAHDDRFQEISKSENLLALNAAWLRSLPTLRVMTLPEMQKEVERRAAALPDREERERKALANEPRYMKLMRALSLKAGQVFSHLTEGNPANPQHKGNGVWAWHFMTDKGHQYMIDADGKAVMFDDATDKPVAEMDAP